MNIKKWLKVYPLLFLFTIALQLLSQVHSSAPFAQPPPAGPVDPSQSSIHTFTQINTGCILAPLILRVHRPFDVPEEQRFTYTQDTETYHFSVRKDDKPYSNSSNTRPRTEARFMLDYSTGIWIFEGQLLVPGNVTGACVAQLRAFRRRTLTMLNVINGHLTHYKDVDHPLAEDVSGNRVHIMIRHDVDAGKVEHYINDELKVTSYIDIAAQKAAAPFYFKCGVYMQDDASSLIEATWQELKVWNCTGVNSKLIDDNQDSTNSTIDDNEDNEDDDEGETHDEHDTPKTKIDSGSSNSKNYNGNSVSSWSSNSNNNNGNDGSSGSSTSNSNNGSSTSNQNGNGSSSGSSTSNDNNEDHGHNSNKHKKHKKKVGE